MVKSTQTSSRAESQRRQQQSFQERELRRRREQSARDRARHERELLERTSKRLTRVLTEYIYSSTPTDSPFRMPNLLISLESITMPPSLKPLPWASESASAIAFDR